MRVVQRLVALILLTISTLALSGCYYASNRYYDFRDSFNVAVGYTSENPVTGPVPPSLGAYFELTDFLHFGAISHNGMTAELDARGTFVGPEYRNRVGFLTWQMLQINQDYESGKFNIFKDTQFPWVQRMESFGYIYKGHPGTRLHYEFFADARQQGSFLKHRGWRHWEYSGFEFAISDPIFTHFGFTTRFGIDLAQFSDFILGWFYVDYKDDDLTYEEFMMRDKPEAYREQEVLETTTIQVPESTEVLP